MSKVAIIGGSGLDALPGLTDFREHRLTTAYGKTSAPILEGTLADREVYFLARHGRDHAIPPHQINYRANIAALTMLEIKDVLAITAVGGIVRTTPPRRIVVPDQIIDYTYGREHTFSDGLDLTVQHVDFTYPFSNTLRQDLITAAGKNNIPIETHGTYGATQGPRLETAAEIVRMAADGCTIVGMTGMPEASLAREVGLNYANCSLVVNWAAGIAKGPIELDEISQHLITGMEDVLDLTAAWLQR